MNRKLVLALAAATTLGAASLTATTPASAHYWGGGYHHHHGGHFRAFGFYPTAYNSCLRTRWVVNRYGNLVPRTVNVCY